MNPETTEKTLVTLTKMCTDLVEENEVQRRLIGSMALHIPREHLPEDERTVLDDVLEGWAT